MTKVIKYVLKEFELDDAGAVVSFDQTKLEWRKEAPTDPGWYQAKWTEYDGARIDFVEVVLFSGEIIVWRDGSEIPLRSFLEWLGPFPIMDGEK